MTTTWQGNKMKQAKTSGSLRIFLKSFSDNPNHFRQVTTTLSSISSKKLNSTSKLKKLKLNSTSSSSSSSSKPSKSLDPIQVSSSAKNKTTKPTSPKQNQTLVDKKLNNPKKNQNRDPKSETRNLKQTKPTWLDQDETDLVSEFRDLPIKFQQTLLPDLERSPQHQKRGFSSRKIRNKFAYNRVKYTARKIRNKFWRGVGVRGWSESSTSLEGNRRRR